MGGCRSVSLASGTQGVLNDSIGRGDAAACHYSPLSGKTFDR